MDIRKFQTPSSKVNAILETPQNEWPAPLHQTLINVSDRIGMSLDILFSTIYIWIHHGNNAEMTYEEVFAHDDLVMEE